MIDLLKSILKNIKYNFKSLIYFEVFYRIIGVFVIFPLTRLLFNLSIKLSKYNYISNELVIEYLLLPTTIIIFICLLVILGIYIGWELIFLSLLFNLNYHKIKVNFLDFLKYGLKKTLFVFKRYHIFIIIPAIFFFVFVEYIQIAGLISTLSIPDFILNEINNIPTLKYSFIFLILFLFILFIHIVNKINIYTLDSSIKINIWLENYKIIKNNRLRMICEFITLNIILNTLFYLTYLLTLAITSLIVLITFGQHFVLGVVFTVFYALYIGISFIASIILIPINFSLVTSWYYRSKQKQGIKLNKPNVLISKNNQNLKLTKRLIILTFIVVFAINISNVLGLIKESKIPVELFNYPSIIAHRGASKSAPENTLAAIDKAIIQGTDIIEIDIRFTKDGIPILLHDSKLGRTTNDKENKNIEDVDLEYIKLLDAGSWFSVEYKDEKIPTLEETLVFINRRADVIIDLKVNNHLFTKSVVELIEKYNLANDVKIMTSSTTDLFLIKKLNHNIETILVVTTFFGNIESLSDYEYIDCVAFERQIISNNPYYIDVIKAMNKKVYIWTVNDKKRLEMINYLDIDGIITDNPLITREVVYSKNKNISLVKVLRNLFSR